MHIRDLFLNGFIEIVNSVRNVCHLDKNTASLDTG
jgi:hypothetical protein